MALIKGKYTRVSVDLEKGEYRELYLIVRVGKGQALAYFIRNAIKAAIRELKAANAQAASPRRLVE